MTVVVAMAPKETIASSIGLMNLLKFFTLKSIIWKSALKLPSSTILLFGTLFVSGLLTCVDGSEFFDLKKLKKDR